MSDDFAGNQKYSDDDNDLLPIQLAYLSLSPRHAPLSAARVRIPTRPNEPALVKPSANRLPPFISDAKIKVSSSFCLANNITPLHATAINGDKYGLQRLLSGFFTEVEAKDRWGRTPLAYAVLGDRPQCVDILLKSGAKPSVRDVTSRSALHWAAHKGHLQCLKNIISRDSNWRQKDKGGVTILHLTTRHPYGRCLAVVLKHVASGEIDDQDNNKRTPLHWAAAHGHAECVKQLLQHNSNPGIPDVEGKIPLHWAASSNSPESAQTVLFLLEAAESTLNWQDYEGRTALHLGVADGQDDVVTLLLSLPKCAVDITDNMFRTPLHYAALLGKDGLIRYFLNCGASVTCADGRGATPLHYAALSNHVESIKLFLRHGQVKDVPDKKGRTAFMWAAAKGSDEAIKAMYSHGADLRWTDRDRNTALHAAALSGNSSTVHLLLKLGADKECVDSCHHTPLLQACDVGHGDVVKALKAAGANLNHQDAEGRTALHLAASGGHALAITILVKDGLDVNPRDVYGRTPLHMATYGGFTDCMEILIEHSAHINSQDNEGMTPLHWAATRGNVEAVTALLDHSPDVNLLAVTDGKDRLTALDCALIGDHQEIVQLLRKKGALSELGLDDATSSKIQAYFPGHQRRRTRSKQDAQPVRDGGNRKQEKAKRQLPAAKNVEKEDPEMNEAAASAPPSVAKFVEHVLEEAQKNIASPWNSRTTTAAASDPGSLYSRGLSSGLPSSSPATPRSLSGGRISRLKKKTHRHLDIPQNLLEEEDRLQAEVRKEDEGRREKTTKYEWERGSQERPATPKFEWELQGPAYGSSDRRGDTTRFQWEMDGPDVFSQGNKRTSILFDVVNDDEEPSSGDSSAQRNSGSSSTGSLREVPLSSVSPSNGEDPNRRQDGPLYSYNLQGVHRPTTRAMLRQ